MTNFEVTFRFKVNGAFVPITKTVVASHSFASAKQQILALYGNTCVVLGTRQL